MNFFNIMTIIIIVIEKILGNVEIGDDIFQVSCAVQIAFYF